MKQCRVQSTIAICAFTALFAACTPARTPDTVQATPPVDLADCRQTKDLDRAIAACTEVIGAGTEDAQVYVNRGFAYILKNDFDRASLDLNEAVRLNPKNPEAFARRGLAFRAKGDDDRAIADFTMALDLGTGDLNVHIDRGMAHLAKGENAQAIADYTAVIERDAGKTLVGQLAFVVRGLARLYSGEPDKAQVDLRRAFDLHPQDPFFAIFLHLAEKRTGSASSLAAAARSYDTTKWPAPAIRMFLGEEPPEDVLAVKGGPVTICEADYFAAEFLLLENRKEEALRLYRKAVSDCPHHILEGVASKAALRSLGASP